MPASAAGALAACAASACTCACACACACGGARCTWPCEAAWGSHQLSQPTLLPLHPTPAPTLQAKLKEIELLEGKAKGMKTKAETQAKYGW
jgi:hypothetical protein